MTTAIFIDGAFFIKRVRHFLPKEDHYNAPKIAIIAMTIALAHLTLRDFQNNNENKIDDLYRIFFYDCPPLEKKVHFPISKKAYDFAKSEEAIFRKTLHQELLKQRKVALRLGKLADYSGTWRLKPATQKELLNHKRTWDSLTDDDFTIDVSQKGVDMRIGVDISAVSLKKQANRMILIAGDADFVPVAKLARREGIEFILDSMHQTIASDLFEHIDDLWTTFDPQKNIQ